METKKEKVLIEKMWTNDEIQSIKEKYDNLMNKTINNQSYIETELLNEEVLIFVNAFKSEFYNRFGTVPGVIYKLNMDKFYPIDLYTLEEICNAYITGPHNIKSKVRMRNIVLIRQIFFYIGSKMGYTLTKLANFIDFDHATVIHSIKTISNLIEIKEPNTIINLKLINDEIEKRTANTYNTRNNNIL